MGPFGLCTGQFLVLITAAPSPDPSSSSPIEPLAMDFVVQKYLTLARSPWDQKLSSTEPFWFHLHVLINYLLYIIFKLFTFIKMYD